MSESNIYKVTLHEEFKRLKTELSHETFTTLGDYTTENNKIIAVAHLKI